VSSKKLPATTAGGSSMATGREPVGDRAAGRWALLVAPASIKIRRRPAAADRQPALLTEALDQEKRPFLVHAQGSRPVK